MKKEIEILDLIRITFRDSGQEIINKNPSIDSSLDLRVLTFSKFSEVATSARLGLVLIQTFEENPILMKYHPSLKNYLDHDPKRLKEFEQFVRAAFIQSIFSIQESALRNLIRELDPISCEGGSSEFKSIYEKLFKTLELNDSVKSGFVTVLDFWREIRNLVHNNFVYFSRKGEDLEILYRGQVYNFKNGEQVPFLSWKFLLLLTCDSADMFKEILNLEKIKQIPRIIDPANIH